MSDGTFDIAEIPWRPEIPEHLLSWDKLGEYQYFQSRVHSLRPAT